MVGRPDLFNIASRIYNRPHLIHPEKFAVILSVLEGRIGGDFGFGSDPEAQIDAEGALTPEASRFVGSRRREDGRVGMARATSGGVALVTIEGSLVNRGAWLDSRSGMTSYEGIAAQLREAAGDPSVKSIALDIDSPGGEAGGMFGLAALIQRIRSDTGKPIVAVVDDMAASAAYGLASAADRIIVSPTSLVGSIGVVMMHLDRSAELATKGVRPTLIFAGDHKVDGNPFGPLPDNVRDDLKASVMAFYDQFLATVDAGRAKQGTTADVARATQARTFIGKASIDAKLADEIGTLADVVADLSSKRPSSGRSTKGRSPMAAHTEEPTITASEQNAAVNAARAEGHAAGLTAGAAAERERVSAIMGLDEAKGRGPLALVAIKTGASLDMAKEILAASPVSAAEGFLARVEAPAAGATSNPLSPQQTAQTQPEKPAASINLGGVYAGRAATVAGLQHRGQ